MDPIGNVTADSAADRCSTLTEIKPDDVLYSVPTVKTMTTKHSEPIINEANAIH
jgi:hypothetical protein